MEVHGYRQCACGCGRMELTHVAHQTGGLAFECWCQRILDPMLRPTEIKVAQARISPPNPKHRKRSNRGRRDTRRLAEGARERAMRRLKNLYPEMYDVLYAQERHAVGLPINVRAREGHLDQAIKTYQGESAYRDAATTGDAAHEVDLQEQDSPRRR